MEVAASCMEKRFLFEWEREYTLVIKKRAINLILDTGTVLSGDGVLRTQSDSGRGGNRKTGRAKSSTSSAQRSVKKEKLAA